MILGLVAVPAMADTYTCQATEPHASSIDAGVTGGAVYYLHTTGAPMYVNVNATPQSLLGQSTSEPSAVFGAAYVRGTNRELWEVTSSGVWTSLGGDITWNPSAVDIPSPSGGHRMVFYRGTNREIWYRERINGTWGPHTSLGGVATSSPLAVSWGNGHVAVFKRGQANDIWYRERIAGVWSDWFGLGGSIAGEPAAVTHGTGTYAVLGRSGSAVYMNRYNGGWSGWQNLGSPPPGAISEPAAVALANGGYAVFVRANTEQVNGALWRVIYKKISLDGGVTWTPWEYIMPHFSTATSNPEAANYGGGYLVAAANTNNGVGRMTYCWGTGQ